jgi:hypothetical protein
MVGNEYIDKGEFKKLFLVEVAPTKLEIVAGMVSDSARNAKNRFKRFSDKVAPYINDFALGAVEAQIVTTYGKSGVDRFDELEDCLETSAPREANLPVVCGILSGVAVDIVPLFYVMNSHVPFQKETANAVALSYYGFKGATQLFAWGARHFKKAYDAKKEELTGKQVARYCNLQEILGGEKQ